MPQLDAISGTELALLIALWSGCALLVFWHADKHGSKRATAWGVAAVLASGLVVPLYFVRYWLRRRRSR